MRGEAGYLRLWRDGAARLLDALDRRVEPLQRDLFGWLGDEFEIVIPARHVGRDTGEIKTAGSGCRWNRLLHALRRRVDSMERPRRWPGGPVVAESFLDAVMAEAIRFRSRMRDVRGFPESEAIRAARSVATWALSEPRADHSSGTQAWRARRLGERRRANVRDRDVELARKHDSRGRACSFRALGKMYGLSPEGVRRAVFRGGVK